MRIYVQNSLKIAVIVLAMSFNAAVSAQVNECFDSAFKGLDGPLKSEPQLLRATVEEISSLTGIDVNELERSLESNPEFTVIVEDQLIPYHEFGPLSLLDQETRSGALIRAEKNMITISSGDGSLSTIPLPAIESLREMTRTSKKSNSSGETRAVWWYFAWAAAGAGTCWLANQLCSADCQQWVASCECGGTCECGPCDMSGSHSCNTCPISTTPPPDGF